MFAGNKLPKYSRRNLSIKASLVEPKTSPRLENLRKRLKIEKPEILRDTFGRNHTYLRISLTERCNLRCLYCMPAEGVKLTKPDNILKTDEILRLARVFVKNGVNKIRLTGGEPTVRRDIVNIIEELRKINHLQSIGMTTNGLTLTRQLPSLINAGLDSLNISLDTLKRERFEKFTRRQGWNRVMAAIDLAIQLEFKNIKLNCVMMRNFNDDELIDFVELTRERPIDVRFIEYMPFSGNNWEQYKMLPFKEMKDIIKEKYPSFHAVETDENSTSKGYCVPGFRGKVGFITSMSEHFCYSCNRLRITADGNLKVCLFEGKSEISLRDIMRNGASDVEIEEIIATAVFKKKKQHADNSSFKISFKYSPIYHPGILKPGPQLGQKFTRFYSKLSHINEDGKARMVDVSEKDPTKRRAKARGIVEIGSTVCQLIIDNAMKKGDVLLVAKISGIIAAKKTSDLIPLCHPLGLTHVHVDLQLDPEKNLITITSEVGCTGKTGVEMEALTAVSVAALTVYDMCKSAGSPEELKIRDIELIEKTGGKSGDYIKTNKLK